MINSLELSCLDILHSTNKYLERNGKKYIKFKRIILVFLPFFPFASFPSLILSLALSVQTEPYAQLGS